MLYQWKYQFSSVLFSRRNSSHKSISLVYLNIRYFVPPTTAMSMDFECLDPLRGVIFDRTFSSMALENNSIQDRLSALLW